MTTPVSVERRIQRVIPLVSRAQNNFLHHPLERVNHPIGAAVTHRLVLRNRLTINKIVTHELLELLSSEAC